ncbi:uncharacterized protein [Patagioenas fasciata]|uniref:uncharacterized protein n=1 Tax=Patagioenas fasciata TaxID=372321 RepID=UPI003A998AFA
MRALAASVRPLVPPIAPVEGTRSTSGQCLQLPLQKRKALHSSAQTTFLNGDLRQCGGRRTLGDGAIAKEPRGSAGNAGWELLGRCSHRGSWVTAPSDATEVTQIAQEVLQSCPCELQGLSPGFPWLVGGDIRDPPALLPPTGHPGLGNCWPCSPAQSLTSRAPASSSPCRGALKKRLHQGGVLAPKIRFCQLPAPIRVPLLLLCPLAWTCAPSATPKRRSPIPLSSVPLWSGSERGRTVREKQAASIIFGCRSLRGGLGEGERPPNCPFPSAALPLHGCLRWEMLVWLGRPLRRPTVITGCLGALEPHVITPWSLGVCGLLWGGLNPPNTQTQECPHSPSQPHGRGSGSPVVSACVLSSPSLQS